ncbi:hypothetical protein XH94_22515 [Bradyrhizobium zhanjiangense]|uniref:Uncharacterized protein n=1 Tax=Bradyrhizobium zhanjiangense TaxID=1325107 RepID=A0A4Q0SGT6_9BRAD|nr:hypothetical protein XH94_22515 [Bradyrhizobium zhanjiangense]
MTGSGAGKALRSIEDAAPSPELHWTMLAHRQMQFELSPLVGLSHMDFAGTTREFAPPLPLAGEADASRAMRSIVPSAAGEGSHRTGIASAILDNPDAEAPPPPPSPQAGEGAHCRCRSIIHAICDSPTPAGER